MSKTALSRFIAFVFRRFSEDRCTRIASSLSYTTLLSLVPLVAVALTVLTAFPVFDQFATQAGEFIVNNFIPASGTVIQENILQFEQAVRGLGAIGTLVLLLTALMTMKTIDQALNDIWRIKSKRKGVSALMVYWTLLTLGPLFIGGSLVLTSYLTSLSFFGVDTIGIGTQLMRLLPFAATAIGFALLYMAVPNQKVPLRSALLGGTLASLLFELAKRGFASYVTHFPSYDVVYGALATIPLFLIWVYISWLIILLGAEITYCLANWPALKHAQSSRIRYTIDDAVQMLVELHNAQSSGEGRSLKQLVKSTGLSHAAMIEYLSCLRQAKIVKQDTDGQWFLAREGEAIRLYDICTSSPLKLSMLLAQRHQGTSHTTTVLNALNQQLKQSLSTTLKQIINEQQGSR